MTEVPEITESERIAKRKVIVYKSRVDPTIVKLTAEKMKSRLFVKFGFSKPNPEEIRVVSVDKYYEPFILVDATYNIDYHKTKVYTLDVGHETEEVRILGETLKPETLVGPTGESRKVIRLEAEECLSYENKTYIVLDKTGREIPADQVPSAPSEDHPQKILKEAGKKAGKITFSPQKGVEMVKARIVKRPPDADKIENELFQISEHAVIYSPIYEITFRNVRTGEEKSIRIDGVTAKIVS
ncbi:MAG: hypothetical protein OEY39_02980 [Candidatus Bathyarchaeota archaeon]|nr:hypothetical protein [Dehalococcoidia bacterium]MDH5419432.1 hypothetical protein [Candidatus Bathyarchaeota archaeon]MDH5623411.1 hypothetical protein [Candidatus Bathyarchaeota archaeon]MDH5636108.1 hypothetical protein [Candidatus Bathyarchaeota archaeon]